MERPASYLRMENINRAGIIIRQRYFANGLNLRQGTILDITLMGPHLDY